MNVIILHFRKIEYLKQILENPLFDERLHQYSPYRIDDYSLQLTDQNERNTELETEEIILNIFIDFVTSILPDLKDREMKYINPIEGEYKNGLMMGNKVIIDSTSFEDNEK